MTNSGACSSQRALYCVNWDPPPRDCATTYSVASIPYCNGTDIHCVDHSPAVCTCQAGYTSVGGVCTAMTATPTPTTPGPTPTPTATPTPGSCLTCPQPALPGCCAGPFCQHNEAPNCYCDVGYIPDPNTSNCLPGNCSSYPGFYSNPRCAGGPYCNPY